MQKSIDELSPSRLDPRTLALFVDFDGTLADIATQPSAVVVPRHTKQVLETLARKSMGALAIVSGRPIADIDDLLQPIRLPVAGVHGLERRDAAGELHSCAIDLEAVARLAEALRRFVADLPGLIVERKPGSVALHYRARPELRDGCLDAMLESANRIGGFETLQGKMVIEAKAGRWNKADAIAAFMRELPFKGRLPVYAGDDVTDEDAFAAIAELNGISIKVGEGETSAHYRAPSTWRFRAWLEGLSRHGED